MRFLLVSPNFAPEMVGIGRYNAEMTEYLSAQGAEVRVIVPPPHYPGWRLFDGYSSFSFRREEIAGALVLRCPTLVAGNGRGIGRIAFMLSFAVVSFFRLLAENLKSRADWIFVTVPNSFAAWGAVTAGRLFGIRTWVHIQDFELDIAAKMGLVGGAGFFLRQADKMDAWFLRRADIVSSISGKMFEKILQRGIPSERAFLLPNWASVSPAPDPELIAKLRRELDIGPGQRVALYAGTMARKQGIPLLGECAERMKSRGDLVFVFCGEGVARSELEQQCTTLNNVRIRGFVPNEQLGSLLAMADVHLLPQRAAASDLVMPSKLGGILLSGRPVVATAEAGSEVAGVLEGRGVVVQPDDGAALCDAVGRLLDDQQLSEKLGAAGQRYARDNLLREQILARFVKSLKVVRK